MLLSYLFLEILLSFDGNTKFTISYFFYIEIELYKPCVNNIVTIKLSLIAC